MMNRKNPTTPANSDNFYDEIDQHRKGGSCSAFSVVLVSGVLFVLGCIIIFMLPRPHSGNAATSATSTLSAKINAPDPNLGYTVRLTDGQITELLRTNPLPKVSNSRASVHSDGLLLEGTYQTIVDVPLSAKLLPKSVDGKLQIEVIDATIGGIRAIPLITDQMKQSLSQMIEDSINKQFSGKITKVTLQDGVMIAEVKP